MKKVVALSLLACLPLMGCSLMESNPVYGKNGVIRDRAQDYEQEQESRRLEIPPHLQARRLNEALQVPAIDSTASVDEQGYAVPRPEFFYADGSSETVSFKREAGERQILVDEPVDVVWAQLLEFWRSNGIELSRVDPAARQMETAWIQTLGEEPGLIQGWLRRLTFRDGVANYQDKLRVTLRPFADNSARTYIRMQHYRGVADKMPARVNWDEAAQDVSYRSEMMFEMLRYLSKAAGGNEATSLLALQNKRSGSHQFGRDARGNPVLKIDAPVETAWGMVEQALLTDRFDLGTRDQAKGIFYFSYTTRSIPQESKEMGFFEWLHSDRGELKISTAALSEAMGFEAAEDEDKATIRYSAREQQVDPAGTQGEERSTDALRQQALQQQKGFKIWLGDRVIYVFGSDEDEAAYNDETGRYEFTGRYQLKLNRTRKGVFLSVLTDQGVMASEVIAEEILWDLKEGLPQG